MRRMLFGLFVFLAIASAVFFFWYTGSIPSFDALKESRHDFSAYVDTHPILGISVFAVIYILVVSASIPLATPLSLLAGFLFGSYVGTAVVVLSATIGATIIFILARYFFRDFFEAKARGMMSRISTSTSTSGFQDILVARLVPAVPFSLINIVAGLTKVKVSDYVLATLIGIIPFSFVYVQAGVQLSEIHSLGDITSSMTVMFASRVALVLFVLYLLRRFFSTKKTAKAN